jgi:hypothetical protein
VTIPDFGSEIVIVMHIVYTIMSNANHQTLRFPQAVPQATGGAVPQAEAMPGSSQDEVKEPALGHALKPVRTAAAVAEGRGFEGVQPYNLLFDLNSSNGGSVARSQRSASSASWQEVTSAARAGGSLWSDDGSVEGCPYRCEEEFSEAGEGEGVPSSVQSFGN